MAAAARIERGYLGTLLRLTLLATYIVEVILDGRAPDGASLPALMEPFPIAWLRAAGVARRRSTPQFASP
jgi:hypothetical protein